MLLGHKTITNKQSSYTHWICTNRLNLQWSSTAFYAQAHLQMSSAAIKALADDISTNIRRQPSTPPPPLPPHLVTTVLHRGPMRQQTTFNQIHAGCFDSSPKLALVQCPGRLAGGRALAPSIGRVQNCNPSRLTTFTACCTTRLSTDNSMVWSQKNLLTVFSFSAPYPFNSNVAFLNNRCSETFAHQFNSINWPTKKWCHNPR